MIILYTKQDGTIIDFVAGNPAMKLADTIDKISVSNVPNVSEEINEYGVEEIIKGDNAPTNISEITGSLDLVKLNVIKTLKENVTKYIAQYWNLYEQQSISQFRIDGNQSQQDAATDIWEWINDTVLSDYYTRKETVENATDVASMYDQVSDFVEHDSTKPDYTLGQIRSLT